MPGANRYELSLRPEHVGQRVMIRRTTQDGYGDVVGPLIAHGTDSLTVCAPDGSTVTVPLGNLVAGKVVPSAPRFRGLVEPPSLTSTEELERIALLGWRALEAEWVDGWLLRAGAGFTGRSNSALPLGPGPGLGYVEDWYGSRGLMPQVQVPLPYGSALDSELDAAGWQAHSLSWVMTAPLEALLSEGEDAVELASSPDENWLSMYHYRGGELPEIGRTILRSAADPTFASIHVDGALAAIGRGACDQGWCGLTAIEVSPEHRRQGLGSQVVRGLARWARTRGASAVYLQVMQTNDGAIALYEDLGFSKHHAYVYRRAARQP